MTLAHIAVLADRGVVSVTGPDAEKLLQGVITNDMGLLATQPAIHAALLSPQGKILFDFFVVKAADGFLLDVARDQAAALAKRLAMYRLRAKADIADQSATQSVAAVWTEDPSLALTAAAGIVFRDPRLAMLGLRAIGGGGSATTAEAAEFHAHRIALAVPEGGRDYAFGDTFPHEALMDQLHGVSFTKGCYVGQEIVSRMQHRGTARKRVVPVHADQPLPATGTEVRALDPEHGSQLIGTLGSTDGTRGLALLRLDRAAELEAKGARLTAADVVLTIGPLPAWATFTYPPSKPEAHA